MKTTKFEYNGVTYEIRSIYDGNSYRSKVFTNGKRLNEYSLSDKVVSDMGITGEEAAFSFLEDVIKRDIIQGILRSD